MNALDFLKAHHRLVEKTFARLDSVAGAEDARLIERLADALATHTQLEQRLYSEVAFKTGDETLIDLHSASAGIARAVAELLTGERRDDIRTSRLAALRDIVRRHIRNDELELFPRVRRLFSDGELEALGQELESELIRIYGRGRPRRFFEKTDALVLDETIDGKRASELRTSVFQ